MEGGPKATRAGVAASVFDAIPRVAAVAATGMAIMVLAGWAWDLEPLKRIFPGLVAMNPMTAMAFVLSGAALWGQHVGGKPGVARDWRPLCRLAAAAVVAIGLLRLAAYVGAGDVGVDRWLFAARLADDGALRNQMAPNTALNFILLGLALLGLDVSTRRGRRPAELLASVVFLVALLALTGYAYRVREFIGVANFIPMALHTAMAFLLLALGVFVARPGGVMAVVASRGPGGTVARRLLPTMLLVLPVLGWLRLEGERQGYYGPGLGVALYTVTNIAVFASLIWWIAHSLYRSDLERARIAALQRDSEERVRLLLDSTAEAIYGIDMAGCCTFINPACVRLLGHAGSDALLGHDMHALIHHARSDGSPYPVAACPIHEAVRDDRPVHRDDEVFWRADGSSFPVEYWAHPMHRDGDTVGAVVTFLDITARREAAERLQQSQARTRAIIDTASDAFLAMDAQGRVIDWNASAEAIFGWSRAEAMGRPLAELIIPPQHRETLASSLAGFFATGADRLLNTRFESAGLRRDGHEFPVEVTIWPVSAGAQTSFNAFVRDITERKRGEAAIQALHAELHANAMQLTQTNRELEAFTYTVSHDLRAPLRHIDGYAQMLHEDAGPQLDDEMRRYLDVIGDSARRMGMLIDDLLAFSRLGRKPVDRVEVEMDTLVRRALEEASGGQPPAAEVRFGALPAAHADPVLLRQVWVNLLSNALKYSATRGSAALVEVSGESDGAVHRYTVRDNGVGFDMRYADKLFGVFQRLHSQEEFEGTGVGLAIVQRIVTRHGGRIWAEAELGVGATFTFELPMIGPSAAMEAAA